MSQSKPFPLPITGVDVLSSETALLKGAVRSAVNVDIGRAGRVRRRDGYTRRVASPGMHSLYHAVQKGWTVVARDNVLYRLDTASYAMTPLATLNSSHPLWFAEYNGNLYFASRSTAGWVPSNSNTARPIGVPTPAPPTVSASTAGGLLPGRYGVAITLVDERGEESGACALQTVDLPEGGGIRLNDLPQRLESTVFVYVTGGDDDQLRLVATPPAVFPTYLIAEPIAQGAGCDLSLIHI